MRHVPLPHCVALLDRLRLPRKGCSAGQRHRPHHQPDRQQAQEIRNQTDANATAIEQALENEGAALFENRDALFNESGNRCRRRQPLALAPAPAQPAGRNGASQIAASKAAVAISVVQPIRRKFTGRVART